jgi:hypothetical protein
VGYEWQRKSEEAAQAARLPLGEHRVRVAKLVFGNDNGPFTSKGGDPQVMVVFADREDREASMYLTLSEKAGWVLAKLLGCFDPPANLAQMEQDGVVPLHFADQEFAEENLLNRELWVQVTTEKGQDGKDYPRVNPFKKTTGPTPAPARPAPSPTAPPAGPQVPPARPAPNPRPPVAAPPPPPPAPTPPPPPPAPADAAPPPPRTRPAWDTKAAAWAHWVEVWRDRNEPDTMQAEWFRSIAERAKPEPQFTAEDWRAVGDAADLPF